MSTPTKEELEKAVEILERQANWVTSNVPPQTQSAIRTVLAALEAAQKDSERVDWLDVKTRSGGGMFRLQWNFRDDLNNENLRAAIDAARTP